ncbi:MAG: aspartate aminotransferase family protein [Alphaproteobacteria bacterium]
MSAIFHRHLKANYPTIQTGDGAYLIDTTGKRYLDASGGAAVSCLGHNNKAVQQAIEEQIHKIAFAHSGFFTNEPAEELAEYLVSKAPKGLSHVYYLCGGSEANEAAMKIARQYHYEAGRAEKTQYISRKQSYHGNTLGALSLGGNVQRRVPFNEILNDNIHFINPCYAYRYQNDDESEAEYGIRAAKELEDKILEIGSEKVAAFFAETIVGATLGCVPAAHSYFKEIRRICSQYDILLILDEVMCGMGRSGYRYACEYEDISPDILTSAKGLGGGYQPIGMMMVSQDIYDVIYKGSGFFQHGHTYISHASATAAALAVQKEIDNQGLLKKIRDNETLFKQGLENLAQKYETIGDIRGRGYFWGIEFVASRATKQPFTKEDNIAGKLKNAGMNEGLIFYPGNGTADGNLGDHLLLAPPFIYKEQQFDELFTKLDKIFASIF